MLKVSQIKHLHIYLTCIYLHPALQKIPGLHPYQQSVDVELIKAFSVEGDCIMDVCMGSGSYIIATLIAGGRKVIGSDANPQYVAVAKSRVKEFWTNKNIIKG